MTQPAPLAPNEKDRLARLKRMHLLDTEPEPLFDEIVKLASEVCGVPIALMSLVDENRQWFKANVGLDGASETHRDIAFCAHTILQNDLFEIADAAQDPRFKNNPLVTTNPNIRFYGGMPLTMPDGFNLGTLCVIDTAPKKLDAFQKNMLKGLSKLVTKALLQREEDLIRLHQESASLLSLVEHSNDAIITETLDGFITSWNPSASQMYGYSADEILGKHISVLYPQDKLHEERLLIERIKNNQPTEHFETARVAKNKKIINISLTLSPIKDLQGNIIGLSKIARDITNTINLKQTLAQEHALMQVTLDSIGDAVITTDKLGNIQYLNPVAESMTGWSEAEAKGAPLLKIFNIIHERTRTPCLNPVDICLTDGKVTGLAKDTVLIHRNGNEFAIQDSAAPIRDTDGKLLGTVLVFHDVSQQRAMANEISYRAAHDSLTGLINRSEFEGALKNSLADPKSADDTDALMFIDLDHFKPVNDTCGHLAGDTLLKEISKVIKTCIRDNDAFARMGGDEFAILLKKCKMDKAYEIASRICKSVEAYRFNYNNQKFRIGASIGLVILDESSNDVSAILQLADSACYQAKNKGRNCVHMHLNNQSDLQEHVHQTLWISRIHEAIEENRFALYCQRIFPLNHQRAQHAEVLLRLVDKSGEIVPPNSFIPTAERFSMMPRIDQWVIKNTFAWIDKNIDSLAHIGHISINISGQSISSQAFPDFIDEVIHALQFKHCAKVCFEITETSAITNQDNANVFFNKISEHGISLSLDDFGSGASSFAYLKNIPANYLKIDGQFIQDLLDDKISQATVKCIIEVAQSTQKKIIAEWVETDTVNDILQKMGVDYAQGYLHHKPAPIDFLTKQQCEYSLTESLRIQA